MKSEIKFKSKIWYNISFYSLLLGWFPFLFFSIWGSWNREIGIYVMIAGLSLCVFGSMTFMPLMRNGDLFKSIDELEEERQRFSEARQKLERKIVEISLNNNTNETNEK